MIEAPKVHDGDRVSMLIPDSGRENQEKRK